MESKRAENLPRVRVIEEEEERRIRVKNLNLRGNIFERREFGEWGENRWTDLREEGFCDWRSGEASLPPGEVKRRFQAKVGDTRDNGQLHQVLYRRSSRRTTTTGWSGAVDLNSGGKNQRSDRNLGGKSLGRVTFQVKRWAPNRVSEARRGEPGLGLYNNFVWCHCQSLYYLSLTY